MLRLSAKTSRAPSPLPDRSPAETRRLDKSEWYAVISERPWGPVFLIAPLVMGCIPSIIEWASHGYLTMSAALAGRLSRLRSAFVPETEAIDQAVLAMRPRCHRARQGVGRVEHGGPHSLTFDHEVLPSSIQVRQPTGTSTRRHPYGS